MKCPRFWWWVLWRVPARQIHSVGNRFERRMMLGKFEVTITYRNTHEPDGYSREELYGMLRTIRREEKRHEWKVPEPEEN